MTTAPYRRISNSEATDAQTCKRKFYNSHVRNGGGIEPAINKGARTIGTVGHLGLDPYFRTRAEGGSHEDGMSLMKSTMANVVMNHEKLGFDLEVVLTAKKTLDRYFDMWGEHENWRILKIEELLEMPFPDRPYSLPIRLDLLVFDKDTGNIMLVDHKWTYDFWQPMKFSLSSQFPKYIAVLRYNGINVHGVLINQLRYRSMKSTDPVDYNRRDFYPVTNQKIQRVLRDHMEVSDWIMKFRELDPAEQDRKATYLMNNLICTKCYFKELCDLELDGAYVEQMLKNNYKTNSYGYNTNETDLEDL